jgi:threonyl-tRNA synthetase
MAWHVERFNGVPVDRGRSDITEAPKEVSAQNALLVFVSYEKSDEGREDNPERLGAREIGNIAKSLGVKEVVLNPYAHLFAELSSPGFAAKGMEDLEKEVAALGYTVKRLSFGYFYEIELKAKGHKLSRVSRTV